MMQPIVVRLEEISSLFLQISLDFPYFVWYNIDVRETEHGGIYE